MSDSIAALPAYNNSTWSTDGTTGSRPDMIPDRERKKTSGLEQVPSRKCATAKTAVSRLIASVREGVQAAVRV
jgi:hypothetical protein